MPKRSMSTEPEEKNTVKRSMDPRLSIHLRLKETQETLEEIRTYLARLCLAESITEKEGALNGLRECQNELDVIKSLPYEFWDIKCQLALLLASTNFAD